MSRQKRVLALIECRADAKAIRAIAASNGLIAEPAPEPGHFHLFNSGRNLASELGAALFPAVVRALDEAAERGDIPKWTIVESALAGASNSN